MNHIRMIQGNNGKISTSFGVTETVVWNRCSYHVPEIVGTNASRNKKHIFTTKWCRPFQEVGYTAPLRSYPCVTIFVDMGALVKTQVENGLNRFFDFWG